MGRTRLFLKPIKQSFQLLESNQGFTLVELLVVVAIVGILARVAMVQVVTALSQRDLQSSVEQLASQVRTMQNVSLQKTQTDPVNKVKMLFTTTSYRIITDSTASPATALPVVELPDSVSFSTAPADLTFDPHALANNAHRMISLSNTSGKRTLVIAPQTGRIRLDSSASPAYQSNEN